MRRNISRGVKSEQIPLNGRMDLSAGTAGTVTT